MEIFVLHFCVEMTVFGNRLTSEEAAKRLGRFGYNEVESFRNLLWRSSFARLPPQLPEKQENVILKFLSFFWGPMPCMIWLAAAVELVQCLSGIIVTKSFWKAHELFISVGRTQHWPDFGVLIGLQLLNGTVAFFEV